MKPRGNFVLACEAVNDPFEKVEGEWTLHQIASHIRDTEKLVYGARIQRTLTEKIPNSKISMRIRGWRSITIRRNR